MKKFGFLRIGTALIMLAAACHYAHAGVTAQDTPTSALQAAVLYPSDGILSPDQPQVVQLGITVQPSPGIPLNTYRLLLRMRKQGGRTVLSDAFNPSQAYSVATLNTKKLVPGDYEYQFFRNRP